MKTIFLMIFFVLMLNACKKKKEEVSVDEQWHYAKDAGKTKEDITLITKPKRTYSFEADGVLLKQ